MCCKGEKKIKERKDNSFIMRATLKNISPLARRWRDSQAPSQLSSSFERFAGLMGNFYTVFPTTFCAPLLNLTLSFSIWEMDSITRHTTHKKSWVKWMFLNETYYCSTTVILMKHLGIESPRGWQFTVWNKIRRKKMNRIVKFCFMYPVARCLALNTFEVLPLMDPQSWLCLPDAWQFLWGLLCSVTQLLLLLTLWQRWTLPGHAHVGVGALEWESETLATP